MYCQLKLNLPRRTKKRLPMREKQTLQVPMQANTLWSMLALAACAVTLSPRRCPARACPPASPICNCTANTRWPTPPSASRSWLPLPANAACRRWR
ncbi:hypothetical protein CO610_08760 [Lysobacteraceae bacterium NML95-0200]|nr:hypothetical protein CO610_08760 [Xanthomonadaceae bacterium NML95-0200]